MTAPSPIVVDVTSNGTRIGTLTAADFMAYCRRYHGCTSRDFLPTMIERFNTDKARAGEPERVASRLAGRATQTCSSFCAIGEPCAVADSCDAIACEGAS